MKTSEAAQLDELTGKSKAEDLSLQAGISHVEHGTRATFKHMNRARFLQSASYSSRGTESRAKMLAGAKMWKESFEAHEFVGGGRHLGHIRIMDNRRAVVFDRTGKHKGTIELDKAKEAESNRKTALTNGASSLGLRDGEFRTRELREDTLSEITGKGRATELYLKTARSTSARPARVERARQLHVASVADELSRESGLKKSIYQPEKKSALEKARRLGKGRVDESKQDMEGLGHRLGVAMKANGFDHDGVSHTPYNTDGHDHALYGPHHTFTVHYGKRGVPAANEVRKKLAASGLHAGWIGAGTEKGESYHKIQVHPKFDPQTRKLEEDRNSMNEGWNKSPHYGFVKVAEVDHNKPEGRSKIEAVRTAVKDHNTEMRAAGKHHKQMEVKVYGRRKKEGADPRSSMGHPRHTLKPNEAKAAAVYVRYKSGTASLRESLELNEVALELNRRYLSETKKYGINVSHDEYQSMKNHGLGLWLHKYDKKTGHLVIHTAKPHEMVKFVGKHVAHELNDKEVLHLMSMHTEESDLSEARGRPRLPRDEHGNVVRPGQVTHMDKRVRPDGEEDDSKHIVMQLRKSDSLNGSKPVQFRNGETHHVSRSHARLALLHHASKRTAGEKTAFEDRLAQSPKSFYDTIGAQSAPAKLAA